MSVNGKLRNLGLCNVGSIPATPICKLYGSVVQLVRILACHARGPGFNPPVESLLHESIGEAHMIG